MANQYTYPHCSINVQDNSVPVPTTTVTDQPLHMALTFLLCQKGPVNTPTVGSSTDLQNIFGSGTFDNTQPYFNHQSVFAKTAMSGGKVCVVRLAPEDAATASLVLECTLTEGPITQYVRNSDGSIQTDTNGNPVVQTDASGNPVTVNGYTATWSTRALASDETYDSVASTSGVTPTTTAISLSGKQFKNRLNRTASFVGTPATSTATPSKTTSTASPSVTTGSSPSDTSSQTDKVASTSPSTSTKQTTSSDSESSSTTQSSNTGVTSSSNPSTTGNTSTSSPVSATPSPTASNPMSYTFPVLGFVAKSMGSYGNDIGFRLWYTNQVSSSIMEAIDSWLYRFQVITLPSGSSGNVQVVSDIFTNMYEDFTFKPSGKGAIDPTTNQDMSLSALLTNNFNETGSNSLEYDVYVYSDNVQQIGQMIQSSSPVEFENMSPYMINILGGCDQNGNPYKSFVVSSSSEDLLNSMNNIWLSGGSDGNTSVSNYESLCVDYVTGDNNYMLQDPYRFPFTHWYDSGYGNTAKQAFLNLMSLRDDIYLQTTTFISGSTPNDGAQDQSAGASLLSSGQTYPESTQFGTAACRMSIDVQAGILSSPTGYTTGWVSPTLWILQSNMTHFSGTRMVGSTTQRPNNVVSLYKQISWTSATQTQKQLNWSTCLNVMTYCDLNTIYYASRRTIYSEADSLLSDETFCHIVTFIKKIVRHIFTYFVGSMIPVNNLKDEISKTIDQAIYLAFNSLVESTTTVSQTAQDLQNGYSYTVTVQLTGTMPTRVWNVIIPINRAQASAASSTTAPNINSAATPAT
ncbi:MAG: hypothetical protein J6S85_23785 [Methanobrevibacter sp.]|nr:hypothetical protein [Methanobrevibacter sp.]